MNSKPIKKKELFDILQSIKIKKLHSENIDIIEIIIEQFETSTEQFQKSIE